jgi:glucosyl-3-phosphoglycerate synthase
MADFYQHGPIATLHRLGNPDYSVLEEELNTLLTPLALILPCHARDLSSPALAGIVTELNGARFIHHLVMGLDGAAASDVALARQLLSPLPFPVSILWNDGPRVSALLAELEAAGLEPGPMGKGRNMRLCLAHTLAATQAAAIAIHDCDIVNYRRQLLVRLAFPVMHPDMGFEVSKGYSARFSRKLDGRVMRLLLTPLLDAMDHLPGFEKSPGPLRFLRYPISGEVCLSRRVAASLRFPSDWGVETGMMADLARVCDTRRVCQVDIAESYDHKHQSLSETDPTAGLNKMACDVALCLLRSLPKNADAPSSDALQHMLQRYRDTATSLLRFYAADARMNLLKHDRIQEEQTIHLFAESIRRAITRFSEAPQTPAGAASYADIEAALPGFGTALASAASPLNSKTDFFTG